MTFDVSFLGTLNGGRALTVNDSGTTTFGGIVGGSTALTSITTDAPGAVALNTTAVTTSGSQSYTGKEALRAGAEFNCLGVRYDGNDARTR